MSWNPVLNLFLEIKNQIPENQLWNYQEGSCVQHWVQTLHNPYYDKLIKPLKINECGNLLLIRYSNYPKIFSKEEDVKITYQKFWNLYDGLYRECRSLVLDKRKNCLVLTPFKKFFNINEMPETSLENIKKRIENASLVEFSDKLDGSMQSVRYYNGKIVMAGSQAVDADKSWRLRDGYKMLTEHHKQMIMNHPSLTFIFEYISPKDAHVVHYDFEGLYLIGIRNVENGEEYPYAKVLDFARQYQVPATKVVESTLEDIIAGLDDKSADEAEGFVLNMDGYKVKIKYNDYVGISRIIKHTCSSSTIIHYYAENRLDDLLSKIPAAYHDHVWDVVRFLMKYEDLVDELTVQLYSKAPKKNQKDFMIWVQENVPKEIRSYVRNRYLQKEINYFRKNQEGYYKLGELEKRLENIQKEREKNDHQDHQNIYQQQSGAIGKKMAKEISS